MPLSSVHRVRSPEDILEDVRGCITSVCNVAFVARLRSTDSDPVQNALLDATIIRLLRLGAEARDLSMESQTRGEVGG